MSNEENIIEETIPYQNSNVLRKRQKISKFDKIVGQHLQNKSVNNNQKEGGDGDKLSDYQEDLSIDEAQIDLEQPQQPLLYNTIIPDRTDRFGNQIIPRAAKRAMGLKSGHKLTFVDQVFRESQRFKDND